MSKYPDLKLDDVFFYPQGIRLTWSSPSLGFGEVTIVKSENEDLTIDSETMSEEFVKDLFTKMIERAFI